VGSNTFATGFREEPSDERIGSRDDAPQEEDDSETDFFRIRFLESASVFLNDGGTGEDSAR